MTEYKYSPELSLILCTCLDLKWENVRLEDLKWNTLERQLRDNVVLSLFSDKIHPENTTIPTSIKSKLKAINRESTMRHLHKTAQMTEILKYMIAAGINAFPTKGPLWASAYYTNPSTRSFSDLDFIIPSSQIHKAVNALEELGFKIEPYRRYLLEEAKLEKVYIEEDTQMGFFKEGFSPVEIHWRILYPRLGSYFLWEDLMSAPRKYKIGDLETMAPSPEFQLLLMITHHGIIEQWSQLKYLCDLIFFLEKESVDLDWVLLEKKAREKGVLKFLAIGLGLARHFKPHLVPNNVPFLELAENYKFDVIFGRWESGRSSVSTQTWRIFLHNLSFRDRFSDRIGVITGHLKFLLQIRMHWHKILFLKKNRNESVQ